MLCARHIYIPLSISFFSYFEYVPYVCTYEISYLWNKDDIQTMLATAGTRGWRSQTTNMSKSISDCSEGCEGTVRKRAEASYILNWSCTVWWRMYFQGIYIPVIYTIVSKNIYAGYIYYILYITQTSADVAHPKRTEHTERIISTYLKYIKVKSIF